MKYLTCNDVLEIHEGLVVFFADDGDPISPAGPRDKGLLQSACSRPFTGLGGKEKYKTIDEKAAAFFHSLVKNHAFHNGNKRTALVSTIWFLDINGYSLEAHDDELFEFVKSSANGSVPGNKDPKDTDEFVEQIRLWIRSRIEARTRNARPMRTTEFLKKVENAGGSYKEAKKGGTWQIKGPSGRTIRLSKATRELSGKQIKVYLNDLQLNQAQSGIRFDEFQSGQIRKEDIFKRFLVVLRKLAHV